MTPAVVCGVDGSPPARAAARLGAALAGRLELGLVLVHALRDAGRRDAAAALLEDLRAELAVPHARLRVDAGPVADRLAAAADGAALLALGGGPASRARVRAALARCAPCPLAVVPPVPRLGGEAVVC